MELNTEMFLAIITYHMLCFTDFIPERGDGLAARVLMGKSFILWVAALMAVNLYFVFKELGRLSKLKWIKKYRIWLRKYDPTRFKIQQEAREEEKALDDEERDRTVRLREQALIKTRVAQLVSDIERDDEFLKPAEERRRRRSKSKVLYGQHLRKSKGTKAQKSRDLTVIMDAGSEEDISDYEVDIFAPMEDPERFQEHLVKEMRAPQVPQNSLMDSVMFQVRNTNVMDLFDDSADELKGIEQRNQELLASLNMVHTGTIQAAQKNMNTRM